MSSIEPRKESDVAFESESENGAPFRLIPLRQIPGSLSSGGSLIAIVLVVGVLIFSCILLRATNGVGRRHDQQLRDAEHIRGVVPQRSKR